MSHKFRSDNVWVPGPHSFLEFLPGCDVKLDQVRACHADAVFDEVLRATANSRHYKGCLSVYPQLEHLDEFGSVRFWKGLPK